uniref:EF-hand domain-containing protein n=1 Tax=Peronospora matthiolae TaxID=2874970 RepID=A0AAV1TME3_9STRA
MVGSVSRVATMAARYTKGRGKTASASPQWLHTTRATALYHATAKCLKTRQFRSRLGPLLSTLGIATTALAVTALEIVDGDAATRLEAHQLSDDRTAVARWAGEREKACTGRKEGRRPLLKQRRKHQTESQQQKEFKMHLDEYKQIREALESLRSRFDMYASRSVEVDDGRCVRAMTFTDFLHSLVLTQFHVHSPQPDLVYSCDFVGNTDGLIVYEEWCLLIHLLQIPKNHFDVAFCMFDLDGDGSVNKTEFCAVLKHLLRASNDIGGGGEKMPISVDNALPRLTTFLFGQYKKKVIAKDLAEALDVLRKKVLRAEFDLSATRDPLAKQQTMSVRDFALTLISHLDPDQLPPFLERVQALNASHAVVAWAEFCAFHFTVRNYLPDIKLAFEVTKAQVITEADFIRAAHIVSGVELSFPVVQLAFHILHSADGALDRSELFKALEMRNTVQLTENSNPRSRLEKLWHCVLSDDSR